MDEMPRLYKYHPCQPLADGAVYKLFSSSNIAADRYAGYKWSGCLVEVAEPTKTAMGLQFRNPVYCGMVKLVSHKILALIFSVRI